MTSTSHLTSGASSPTIGVVAHGDKSLEVDVDGLRQALARRGVEAPVEVVPKASHAHERVERLLDAGVDRLLTWGGDGTVRRCIHTLVERDAHGVSIGILPAGTANLLARNVGVPLDLDGALDVALGGSTVAIDIGTVADAHFAVSGGIGFDADLLHVNDQGRVKERLGRLSHLWSALRILPADLTGATVRVDGELVHEGPVSGVHVANVSDSLGGLEAFPDADPTDGVLDVAVVRARTRRDWLRIVRDIRRGVTPEPDLAIRAVARTVEVQLDDDRRWQVDGSDREPRRTFSYGILPGRIDVCVPA